MTRELDFNAEEEEDDDEDQPLIQRKTKKRALESLKLVEAEVPAKRTRRVVQKYTASSKARSSAKVATTTTKKRKAIVKVVDVDSRPFIDHLVVDMRFSRDHALESVGELLEN